eukprot:IDg14803t1
MRNCCRVTCEQPYGMTLEKERGVRTPIPIRSGAGFVYDRLGIYKYDLGSHPPDAAKVIGTMLPPVWSPRSGCCFTTLLLYAECTLVPGGCSGPHAVSVPRPGLRAANFKSSASRRTCLLCRVVTLALPTSEECGKMRRWLL